MDEEDAGLEAVLSISFRGDGAASASTAAAVSPGANLDSLRLDPLLASAENLDPRDLSLLNERHFERRCQRAPVEGCKSFLR